MSTLLIHSILDNDFYKFTMMYAVLQKYPQASVEYQFINRTPSDTFDQAFLDELIQNIQHLKHLTLTSEEYHWLRNLNLFPQSFLDILKNFQFNPQHVSASLTSSKELKLSVQGPWWQTILFEVPLMACITEIYYKKQPFDLPSYKLLTAKKAQAMSQAGCLYTDFGTRRRHSYAIQDLVVQSLKDFPGFLGTSNVHFAMKYHSTPIGTMAHEWIMGHAGMFGVHNANVQAMKTWYDVFQGKYNIALTDTYTTDAFFDEFTQEQAVLFDGLRQDSGIPEVFVDKAIAFYKSMDIDPAQKKIIFSDGLTYQRVLEIQKYCQNKIQALFGIGTHLTNDRQEKGLPLNIVIKLKKINDVEVYKITDSPSKGLVT